MAIKLAFSTAACPDWTLDKVAQEAKTLGYDGVELRTLGPAAASRQGSASLACDPSRSDPRGVRDLFKAVGVEPVCLSTSLALHYRDASVAKAAHGQAMAALELSAAIGCRYVRLFGKTMDRGQDPRAVIARIADRARPLAEKAAELGVQLLFENAGSFAQPREWWLLLNVLDHPMVGLCWNVANAAAADGNDAGGAIGVPMLNSRIRLAKVQDLRLGENGGFVPLGEGDVGVEPFIKRLLGVGYDGYVSVEWDRLRLPTLAPAQEYLPDAAKRLKGWIEAVAKSMAGGPGDAAPPALPGAQLVKKAAAAPKPAAAPAKA